MDLICEANKNCDSIVEANSERHHNARCGFVIIGGARLVVLDIFTCVPYDYNCLRIDTSGQLLIRKRAISLGLNKIEGQTIHQKNA